MSDSLVSIDDHSEFCHSIDISICKRYHQTNISRRTSRYIPVSSNIRHFQCGVFYFIIQMEKMGILRFSGLKYCRSLYKPHHWSQYCSIAWGSYRRRDTLWRSQNWQRAGRMATVGLKNIFHCSRTITSARTRKRTA